MESNAFLMSNLAMYMGSPQSREVSANLAEHEDKFDALPVAPGPLQAGRLLDEVGCSMYDELRIGFEQCGAERYRSCLPPVRWFLALGE